MTLFSSQDSKPKADKLKKLLDQKGIVVMPGCFDALSAKLIEREGINVGFMSGFAVSSTRLGMPDAGLISFSEMAEQVRNICNVTSIPIIFDGDTGYGNAVNVYRTVRGFADAGAAAIMIEDQKWPKKCGHTKGKDVVEADEANSRIKAAVDASKMNNKDILVMARTDAIATRGLDDAIKRMQKFSELGADILFVEAIKSKEDMKRVIKEVPGHHMINLIEDGETPLLEINELEDLGFKIAVFPLTLMSASVKTMQESLQNMKNKIYNTNVSKFSDLRDIVGFNEYYEIEDKYK
ncbi:carboxyphosphonoenolpyruvate phosphonomutase [Candidatus Pelagibacter sp. IMCC9063]|jgi:2-methylisocitrate lyase-like PEP mutase family enzyme|uniref:isocitrate lyase/PEP mutase family protein n=1 Tax=Pelagibacter sp. (strain IMCC9063) TaxID=1002672 RepID=UPI0002046654|nr:isocitrate lyase/PEP mutase family protein [Candidatus Pelagibacter sp. IMCC9063]AEA80725.1 carboxyphosphonoenolpyruvate phosphonomutase [Candidatus Pelagibacter sp. IMCC9063]